METTSDMKAQPLAGADSTLSTISSEMNENENNNEKNDVILQSSTMSISKAKNNNMQDKLITNTENNDLKVNKKDDLSPKEAFKLLWSNITYRKYIFWYFLLFISFVMRASFIAAYGAAYFGGCKTVSQNIDCKKEFDYDTFNLWSQYSNSIGGVFALLSSPIIGKLSDFYGRKPLLYFQMFNMWIPYIFMLFSNNILIYLCLMTLAGFNGSIVVLTPVNTSYIADIFAPNLRIYAYGAVYLVAGCAIIFSVICGYSVSHFIDDHANFYVINVFFVITILYLYFFIDESLPISKRSAVNISHKKHLNPLFYLRFLFMNRIIFWISMISAFATLPDVGLMDVIIVVLSDLFDASTIEKSNQIAVLFLGGWGIGLICAPTISLPIMRRYFSEMQVLFITLICMAMASLCILSMFLFHSYVMIFISGVIFVHGVLCFAPLQSIQTKYVIETQQGLAFGVVFAVKALCNIIAPVSFAWGYHYGSEIGFPTAIFIAAFAMIIASIIMTRPLHFAIKKENKKRSNTDDDDGNDEIELAGTTNEMTIR